jgi:hypothetical protein
VAAFLVDESLPRAVGRALEAAGHDVADARDIGLRGATDEVVVTRARTEKRIVIAGDVDFSKFAAVPVGVPWRGDRRPAPDGLVTCDASGAGGSGSRPSFGLRHRRWCCHRGSGKGAGGPSSQGGVTKTGG